MPNLVVNSQTPTLQALEDGQLGPYALGWVSDSAELWNCVDADGERTQVDFEALKAAGVCQDPFGGLLDSPHWDGMRHYPLLSLCGIDPRKHVAIRDGEFDAYSEDQWEATGLRLGPLLERLIDLPGYDFVCITPELASRRRSVLP
ncbi:MAG: hypothetical protein AAF725_20710 [Acidobacteriota bacterium]